MRNLLCILSCCLAFIIISNAQSLVEFQFANPTITCGTNQICFDVQVRAVTPMQADGEIALADVQYRLFYPNNIMTYASITNSLANYGDPVISDAAPLGTDVLNLLGPGFAGTDGIGFIDYLIPVTSNSDAEVLTTTDWTTTSVICFNPVDNVNGTNEVCTQLVWTQTSTSVYTNAFLAASEVEDGGGPGIEALDDTKVDFGWSTGNMDPNQACLAHDCLLPIELISFNATKKEENQVELNWITTSEVNADKFELERSIGTSNRFETLTSLNAKGDLNVNTHYQYTDVLASKEVHFYRLKMMDKDGSFEYSSTIAVNRSEKGASFNTYPNPFAKIFNVEFEVFADQELVEIFIYDQLGKTGIQRLFSKELERGSYIENFNVELPAGQYIIRMNIGNQSEQRAVQVIE